MSSKGKENEVKNPQKRSEFMQNFNNKEQIPTNKTKTSNGRWNLLYNQSKMKKAKEEKYREEMLKNRNKSEYSECTFFPQKFNNYKMKEKEDENGDNNNESEKNLDKNLHSFMKRQNKWLHKRQLQIEGIKEKKNNKDVEECFFRPIMSEKVIDKEVLNDKAPEIIEDPESYNQYIKRLELIRENKNKMKDEEKKIPGSGFLWNNKPKKYNYNYDYTRHENADKIINRPKSMRQSNYQNLIKNKNIKNKNSNYDKVYKELYSSQTKKNDIAKFEQNYENQHLIKIDRPIEFGQALDLFHRELYSFDLMDD